MTVLKVERNAKNCPVNEKIPNGGQAEPAVTGPVVYAQAEIPPRSSPRPDGRRHLSRPGDSKETR